MRFMEYWYAFRFSMSLHDVYPAFLRTGSMHGFLETSIEHVGGKLIAIYIRASDDEFEQAVMNLSMNNTKLLQHQRKKKKSSY